MKLASGEFGNALGQCARRLVRDGNLWAQRVQIQLEQLGPGLIAREDAADHFRMRLANVVLVQRQRQNLVEAQAHMFLQVALIQTLTTQPNGIRLQQNAVPPKRGQIDHIARLADHVKEIIAVLVHKTFEIQRPICLTVQMCARLQDRPMLFADDLGVHDINDIAVLVDPRGATFLPDPKLVIGRYRLAIEVTAEIVIGNGKLGQIGHQLGRNRFIEPLLHIKRLTAFGRVLLHHLHKFAKGRLARLLAGIAVDGHRYVAAFLGQHVKGPALDRLPIVHQPRDDNRLELGAILIVELFNAQVFAALNLWAGGNGIM
mmetsp:Transcript_18550/g.30546  ORF Transcript_18550/g.30546 Transcript_18550/m.30546 type:complete len:316 (-) Transcript_18550:3471-4418(-)